MKCLSTRPVMSMKPIRTSQRRKAMPVIRWTMVAASHQMNCIAMPITAETGAIFFNGTPAFHWCRAARRMAKPAAVNPIFPRSHRRRATNSVGAPIAPMAPVVGASTVNAMAHAPETAVITPDKARKAGNKGLSNRSLISHERNKSHPPTNSVIPETNLEAPPAP